MARLKPAYRLVLNEEGLAFCIAPRLTNLNLTLCHIEEIDQLDAVLYRYRVGNTLARYFSPLWARESGYTRFSCSSIKGYMEKVI